MSVFAVKMITFIKMINILIYFAQIKLICGLWPPEYVIHLDVTETFIISDMFDSDDAEDFSEEDMNLIKRSQVKHIIKPGDEKKNFMLREFAERKNREAFEKELKTTTFKDFYLTKTDEYLYDFNDEPVNAEFVDVVDESEQDNIKKRFNKSRNKNGTGLKRDDYNYEALKQEYDEKAIKDAKSSNVLKYVEVTEKEGLKDSAKNILSFKQRKNCTAEERKGIGFNAIRCFFKDIPKMAKKPKSEQKKLLSRLLKLVLIWLGVYVIIAVPCWCTRGWCCCCCRCKFCKPRKTIEAAKQFLAENPVGVLHIDGKEVKYTPTVYEHYAQQRLEKVVMKL